MRIAEGLVFLGLASALHAGVWAALPATSGSSSAGSPGDAQITLAAAAPSHAALVQSWTRPPETGVTPERPTAQPADTRPDAPRMTAPGPALAPAPDLPALLPAALPRADRTPPAPVTPPLAHAPEAPRAPSATDTGPAPARAKTPAAPAPANPQMAAPAPDAAPRADTAPPPPLPKPAPKAEKPRSAQAPSAPSTGGGQAKAKKPGGQSGTAKTHSRDGANAQALIAGWGAKIQRKVHRRVLTPRGVSGSGTVRIALTVARDGSLRGVRVTRSSGIKAFDQAALNAVRRAGRFPAAPKGLTKSSYDFALSLKFRG